MFNVNLQRQFTFGSRSLSSSQRMARAPLGDSLLRSPQKSADFRGPRLEKSYTKGIVKLYEWRESAGRLRLLDALRAIGYRRKAMRREGERRGE